MTDQFLLHDKTAKQVKAFLQSPSHALLITGQPGAGKEVLGRYVAAKLLNTPVEKLDNYPYFMVLSKPTGKQEIPIEAVRQLTSKLTLKPSIVGTGQAQKLVLIGDAQLLSEEAQNALLKLVEEPPPATALVLTAPSENDLLPTIASRVQKITVAPVSLDQSLRFFEKNASQAVITSAWSLSQGSAGLMSAILENDQDHPLKKSVEMAKSYLKMDTYQRILFTDDLGSRTDLLNFLDALARVLTALHQTAVKEDKVALSQRLIRSRKAIMSASKAANKNASARLTGLDISLNLQI
jgi:hypothetical protein